MAKQPARNEVPPMADAGKYAGAGMGFAASILLFLFVGHWLDGRLGTGPWLMILGVVVGAVAGFYSMYSRLVIVPERERRKKEAERE
jgi:ATP synthase protein I